MSKTFRIYNPTKNLQDKDPYLQFVRYWIPELKGYTMSQILAGKYKSNYPEPILDWKQTRKTNGKIVSDLRKQVKERLEQQGGEELEIALGAKETVEKYIAAKDKQYKEMKSTQI
jgi:deoxyribodipyrimidine photo-lyase